MATSEANTKRRVKTGKSRVAGKVCERCGRVLTTTERMLAEVMIQQAQHSMLLRRGVAKRA